MINNNVNVMTTTTTTTDNNSNNNNTNNNPRNGAHTEKVSVHQIKKLPWYLGIKDWARF